MREAVFVAHKSESHAAAQLLKRSLVAQGLDESLVLLWNPTAPWQEPIFEVGRRIMNAALLVVVTDDGLRRSSWVDAEMQFARRVGVPIARVRAAAAGKVKLSALEAKAESAGLRLVDTRPWRMFQGDFEIQVLAELRLLQEHAADRKPNVFSAIRRRLATFDADLRVLAAMGGTVRSLVLVSFAPRGLLANFVYRPLVQLAEKRGWLDKLQPIGDWEQALPTFVGGAHPFFDYFGPPTSWFFSEVPEDTPPAGEGAPAPEAGSPDPETHVKP